MPLPQLAPVTCRSRPAFSRLCRHRASLVPDLLRSLLPPWPMPYHGIFFPDDRCFSAPPRHQQPTGILPVAVTTGPPALSFSMTTRGRRSAVVLSYLRPRTAWVHIFHEPLCAPVYFLVCVSGSHACLSIWRGWLSFDLVGMAQGEHVTGANTTLTAMLSVTRCSCCCSSSIYASLLPCMSFVARNAQIYVRVGLLNAVRFLGECGVLLSGSADTEVRACTNRRPARRARRHGGRERPVSAALFDYNWSISNPVLRWCASVACCFLATGFSFCVQ